MTKIPYDVSDVQPFPLGRDPDIEGMHPKRRRRQRQRVELEPELERYRLYTVEQLDGWPPVSWLISGYLAVGEFTVVYGKGDTYKSFVALDWACWLANQGHSVVYIVAEGASGIRARIAAWMKHHDVDELPDLFLMPTNVNLHEADAVETWLDAMREQLGERQPVLVVVDTLARNFVGGSESDPKDMGLFVEGVERIRRELETAVVVLHHTTKEGNTERGTESLRNASFAMFKFHRLNQSMTVRVTCDRMKDAEPPGAVTIRPTKVELPELTEEGKELVTSLVARWQYSGRAEGSDEAETEAEISASQRRLLRELGEPKYEPKGAAPGEVCKTLKISSAAFKRTVRSLVESGLVRSEGSTRDRRYFPTEKGFGSL